MRTQVSHLYDRQVLYEAQALPASGSLSTARIANVDRLRILAAVGIVWFHTEGAPYRDIAYAGLPIFLLVFCSLLTSQGCVSTSTDFLKRRWNRLLKPWLFWSAVYGLCRLVKALHPVDVGSLREMLSAETLLAGTSIHLWYLPYAFLSGMVIYGLNRWTSRVSSLAVILATTALGMVFLAIHAMGTWSHLARPLPQWEFGSPAIVLGIAVGRCLTLPSQDSRRRFLVVIAFVVAVECQVFYWLGFGSQVLPHGIAVVLVCLAYCTEIRSDVVVASLAPLAFGVYLIHPLVAYALHQIPAAAGHCAVVIPLTVCISALATLVLMKTPLRRFV